jgi:large-conductance mechanosensitive channel
MNMIGAILLFLIVSVLIFFGIRAVQKMSGNQALLLTKVGMYAIISTTLAMLLLFGIVILF